MKKVYSVKLEHETFEMLKEFCHRHCLIMRRLIDMILIDFLFGQEEKHG